MPYLQLVAPYEIEMCNVTPIAKWTGMLAHYNPVITTRLFRILGMKMFCQLSTVNNESLEWLKLGEFNKTSHGLIVSWWMKVWWILSIHQIRQTLATPNFCVCVYIYIYIYIFTQTYILSVDKKLFKSGGLFKLSGHICMEKNYIPMEWK